MGDNSLSGAAMGVVLGILFAAAGGYMIYDQRQAVENADRVEATIVGTDVREASGSDGQDGGTKYYPVVEYRYTYDGQEYTNDNVFPGSRSRPTGEARAEEIASEYDRGDTVTVHVDPENPSESFLIQETDYLIPALFGGFGLFTILAGGWSLVKKVL